MKIVRKCELKEVPIKETKHGTVYDWSNAVGLTIPFEYDGIKDSFIIIGYTSRDKVSVFYNQKTFVLYGKYIRKGKIGKLFNENIHWRYCVGDNIKDTINSHLRDITITQRRYTKFDSKFKKDKNRNYKWYQYKCNVCGYDCAMDDFWVCEYDLTEGKGCGCCAGTKVVKGINDLATTAPWIVPYIKNKDYINKHTKMSNKEVQGICPVCGFEKITTPHRLIVQGYNCPRCFDGISYPEKFMMSILNQSKIAYKYQASKKTLPWANKYKYDFYLLDYNWIIETHGLQHYLEDWNGFPLQKKIDNAKRALAKENEITNYIEIDCSKSEKDFIKQSITQSDLNKILSEVDYEEADLFASSSILLKCVKIYDEHPEITIDKLAEHFHISKNSVVRYVKAGRQFGLCKYRDERKSKGKSKML